MHKGNAIKENKEVDIGSRHKAQRLYQKKVVYYIISRAFIGIPGTIVLYSFPLDPLQQNRSTLLERCSTPFPNPCQSNPFDFLSLVFGTRNYLVP